MIEEKDKGCFRWGCLFSLLLGIIICFAYKPIIAFLAGVFLSLSP